jgi:thiol-disulfide isomerase/thioredoxin
MGRRDLLGGLIGGTVLTAAGWMTSAAASRAAVSNGDRVPWPTEVRIEDGRLMNPADWMGQVVVMVFFSTSCGFCRRHNQRVELLRRQIEAEHLPIRLLGVAQDRDPQAVRRYLSEQGLGMSFSLDYRPLRDALSARSVIPLTAVVDALGHLRELIPGEMAEDDVLGLRRWIDR